MHYEVEKKAFLKEKDKILSLLSQKANYIKDTIKKDTYFIEKNIDIKHFDSKFHKAFRIRNTSDNEFIVTFKDKTIISGFEISEESEFFITDEKTFFKFADYIGFKILVEKEKHTKLFQIEDINLEFNYIKHLGYFLEIEIICNNEKEIDNAKGKISKIFSELEIKEEDIIERLYIEMLIEKL